MDKEYLTWVIKDTVKMAASAVAIVLALLGIFWLTQFV